MKTRTKFILSFCLAAVLLLGSGIVMASSTPAIGWWVLGSSGGLSSGGELTLNGTIGQAIVGRSAGGAISLSAGYWTGSSVLRIYLPILGNSDG